MRRSLCVALVVALGTSSVHADQVEDRYGLPIAGIDLVVAVAYVYAGLTIRDQQREYPDQAALQHAHAIAGVATVVYLAAPAIMHAAHGNSSGALRSVTLRAGAPLLAMTLNRVADLDVLAPSLAVGIVAAMVVDAVWIARVRRAEVAPIVGTTTRGAVVVGFAGQF